MKVSVILRVEKPVHPRILTYTPSQVLQNCHFPLKLFTTIPRIPIPHYDVLVSNPIEELELVPEEVDRVESKESVELVVVKGNGNDLKTGIVSRQESGDEIGVYLSSESSSREVGGERGGGVDEGGIT
jgi:hypothetical protein